MYTTPTTTVGLASRVGVGLPLITGGCQCHTCVTEPEFDVVNAVALLIELCCGPCMYWGQSRFGPAAARLAGPAVGAPAAPAAGASTTPARPSAAARRIARRWRPTWNITNPFHCLLASVTYSLWRQLAEADGNRTRQPRGARLTGFEDRGGHQAPGRLRARPYCPATAAPSAHSEIRGACGG